MNGKSIFMGAGALVFLISGVCFGEQDYNRERYQIIIDRAPFGKAEVVVATELSTTYSPDIQNLDNQYRLNFLMKSNTDGEIRAGFQNLKPQAGESKSEIISGNETFQGMKLIDVDLARSTASVEYAGQVLTFTMKAVKQPTQRTTQAARRNNNNSNREPTVMVEQLSPEELIQRREEIRLKNQELQMDILRKGQPPLPVPLTLEMDEQLVFEGVLPPVE